MNQTNEWYGLKKEVTDWKGIMELYNDFSEQIEPRPNGRGSRWICRGDKYCSQLKTSLEKKFDLYGISDAKEKRKYEKNMIRKFQRKASLYLGHEPDPDDILEWLSVMQHYEAPTRLLDWTYSFFNAVYFALAENEKGIVWAFNAALANKPAEIEKMIPHKIKFKAYEEYFMKKEDILKIHSSGDKLKDLAIASYLIEEPMLTVYAVNPFKLNQRLTMQQGLFLIVGDIAESFDSNIKELFKQVGKKGDENLFKIPLRPDTTERKNILRRLKDMHITNETLFPGLVGFAKSVGESLAYPEQYPVD